MAGMLFRSNKLHDQIADLRQNTPSLVQKHVEVCLVPLALKLAKSGLPGLLTAEREVARYRR